MFVVFLIMFVFTALISWRWVTAIDYMQKNHPDYKGEDFLNWDGKHTDWDSVPTNAGRDGWDDNSVHTEGDF